MRKFDRLRYGVFIVSSSRFGKEVIKGQSLISGTGQCCFLSEAAMYCLEELEDTLVCRSIINDLQTIFDLHT
jgi:hypothetical protein